MKNPKTSSEKTAPKAKAASVVAEETKATPKKTSPDKAPVKKAKTVAPKPVAETPEIPMSERIGLTAGSIWQYLANNGVSSVAKLVRELAEEEKIIQRSIGWLAQEDKITLAVIDRVETIALKV